MLNGTKKIFPEDYDEFIEAMIEAAEDDNLPVGLQYREDKVKKLTLQDLHDLMYDFYNDTGLNLTATFFMCDECGQLHLLMEVDYPEKDDDNKLIQ